MSSQFTEAPDRNRTDTNGHMHNTAPTRFVEAGGTRFAYRRFGNPVGTPIVLLQHFMGNLDTYDPAITDALATGREVILTDNAGVGLSTGVAPNTVVGMARDAASFIDASTRSISSASRWAGTSPSRSPPIGPSSCDD
jgi:alpha-beta hydrolase superfamily lysophospholipase